MPATQAFLAQQLAQRLQQQKRFIVTVESCTGGQLAAALTALSGSSQWFERGYITYSNQAKQQDVAVSAHTLATQGAVSEATALEMAVGALKRVSGADVAMSTTGIAGPTGATADKPVGMVCFGFALRTKDGLRTLTVTQHFAGERRAVQQQAVHYALQQILSFIDA